MDTYRTMKCCLGLILAAQLSVGLAALLTRNHEIFPIFSWFLFALTPESLKSRPEIWVEAINEVAATPRTPLESNRLLIPAVDAPAIVALARRMADAVKIKNKDELRLTRKVLEAHLPDGLRVRYSLMEVEYNPVERFQSGAVLHQARLGEYISGDP